MVALNRRSRLYRAFKPVVDGLKDKAAHAAASEGESFDREWFGGQWQRSYAHSGELEIVERMSGHPNSILGRAFDGIHRGELVSVAIVALGADGVIHTAWSDGDLATMSAAAYFLGDDLKKASRG